MLALAFSAVWAASLGAYTIASAASTGSLTVQSADMPGQRYDFQLNGKKAVGNAQFYFQDAVARVELGCDDSTAVWELDVGMGQGPYTVAQNDHDWVPTDQESSFQTYQGAAQIPGGDQCPRGQQLQVIHHGLSFGATLTSPNDTLDQLRANFHAWDAHANRPQDGNIDCASSSQNPITDSHNGKGIDACSGAWAPTPPQTTAASYVPPPASQPPAPSPSNLGSNPAPRQPSPVQLPVVVRDGSVAGTSNTAAAAATSPDGGPVDISPGSATLSPGTAPVVIGANTPLGAAPLLIAITADWVPLLAILGLLPLVLLVLLLVSRRRRRTDVPPPPVAGHF